MMQPAIPWASDLKSACDAHATRLAVFDGATGMTYRELGGRAAAVAQALLDAGVTPGEPVATSLRNSHAAVWGAFGVRLSGAAETPLNPALGADELRHNLAITGVKRVLTTAANADAFKAFGCTPMVIEDLDTARGDLGKIPPVPREAHGRIGFTSGTTGAPKAIVQTHGARWIGNLLQRAALPTAVGPGSRILLVTPYMHGASVLTMAFLERGGSVVLLDGADMARIAPLLEEGSIDHIFAPPTVLAKLTTALPDRHFPGMRAVFCGTAPLSPTLYGKACAMFGPVIRIAYGKTELTNPIAVLTAEQTDAYYAEGPHYDGVCVGYPASGVEIALRGEDGAIPGPGEDGEVLLRGQHIYAGHYATDGFHPLEPGAFHETGDLGRFDMQGRLHLVGRMADVMKSGGYKVHPDEIERALAASGQGAAVAVISLPSEYWGEIVVAVAEGADAGWPERARSAVAGLGRHKQPRLHVTMQELPRNVQGKMVRRRIRERVLAEYGLVDGPHPRLERRG
ncbi:class I adenylate-forming enzyme family protein [Humitalea sp. 24SJ18S-53]|uniref:class I adenylate-forming enzyme family protein n=1 Tax=Humitalea sp. 24SJ18S-53 TaxID=3422307 RepID=UPI003D67F138